MAKITQDHYFSPRPKRSNKPKLARIGTLFVHLDEESVASWFYARATDQRGTIEKAQKEYAKVIKDFVKKDLEKKGFKGVKINWSQKAGCSCGCSPGYTLKAEGHKNQEAFKEYSLNRRIPKSYAIRYDFGEGKLSRRAKKDPDDRSGLGEYYLKAFGFKVPEKKTLATTKEFNKYS